MHGSRPDDGTKEARLTTRRFGIHGLAALAALLLTMVRADAQSASTEISVTLVEIPVEVLHDGEPVKGLTATAGRSRS